MNYYSKDAYWLMEHHTMFFSGESQPLVCMLSLSRGRSYGIGGSLVTFRDAAVRLMKFRGSSEDSETNRCGRLLPLQSARSNLVVNIR